MCVCVCLRLRVASSTGPCANVTVCLSAPLFQFRNQHDLLHSASAAVGPIIVRCVVQLGFCCCVPIVLWRGFYACGLQFRPKLLRMHRGLCFRLLAPASPTSLRKVNGTPRKFHMWLLMLAGCRWHLDFRRVPPTYRLSTTADTQGWVHNLDSCAASEDE